MEQGENKVWSRKRLRESWESARRKDTCTKRERDRDRISLTVWGVSGLGLLKRCYVFSVFTRSCKFSQPSLSLSGLSFCAFLLMTLASLLPRLLGVFLLHFLMLRSMARWVLFIYGHALSVCVGLSNIHLSCAAIIQSLIPSHMQGMKYEHWSLLWSQFKVEGVFVCVAGAL